MVCVVQGRPLVSRHVRMRLRAHHIATALGLRVPANAASLSKSAITTPLQLRVDLAPGRRLGIQHCLPGLGGEPQE